MKKDNEGKCMHVVILVRVEAAPTQDVGIKSRSATQSYRDNWDNVFKKKPETSTLN